MYNGSEFNTKVTQFDDSHIQIDFSSQYYKRGFIRDEFKMVNEENYKPDRWYSGRDKIFPDTDQEGNIIDCRSYSSAKRTRQHVYKYARSNHWSYFCTFTFDKEKIDRNDIKLCQNSFLKFFRNLKNRKYQDLKYMFFVEMHTSGDAIHFHGLIDGLPDSALEYMGMFKSHHKNREGKKIWSKKAFPCFKLKDYKLGFCSLSPIEDQGKVCNYCAKYITKTSYVQSRLNVKGQHLYFMSHNVLPPKEDRFCVDQNKLFDWIHENYPGFRIVYQKQAEAYSGNWINYIQLEKD